MHTKPLSYIELSQDALLHNLQLFRSLLRPEIKLSAVIKANAYGHGQNGIAKIIEPYVDYFQIDDLLELRKLRLVSQKPTLVLGYVASSELEEAVALDGILVVYDTERLQILDKIGRELGKKPLFHLKIDALLGRQGILPEKLDEFFEAARQYRNITIDGIYAHFANIEDTTDFTHAARQIALYEESKRIAESKGFTSLKTHIAATSGILAYEKDHGHNTIARLGIGMYGMWPSEELRAEHEQPSFELKPVMRWVTHVAQVKTLPAGHPIGYGLTHTTTEATKIAVIPQGYSDGYDRRLSNIGEALIQGTRCKVLGRIAMNMFVADVSHLDYVQREDEVVLLGSQGSETIYAEELAKKLDTINYEITARISPLLPKIAV